MAKIIFLGTAASVPSFSRDNTSLVFIYKRKIILIDCPGSIHFKLLKVGIDFKKIKNIIITHQHPDHFYGIIGLIHAQGYLNDSLNIFTNQPTANLLKILIKKLHLDEEIYPEVNFFNVFKKRFFYESKDFKIKAILNSHIKDSFGIKILIKNKKSIVYSSDTSFSQNIIEEAKGSDYLIHDCTASSFYFKKHPQLYKMHTSSQQLVEIAQKTQAKRIIPIHFLLLDKKEEKRIKKELRPIKERLVFPKDFLTLLI